MNREQIMKRIMELEPVIKEWDDLERKLIYMNRQEKLDGYKVSIQQESWVYKIFERDVPKVLLATIGTSFTDWTTDQKDMILYITRELAVFHDTNTDTFELQGDWAVKDTREILDGLGFKDIDA